MNRTQTTIAAATAAAAIIGTGILVNLPDAPEPVETDQPAIVEFVNDVKPIEVPVITVPSLDIVDLAVKPAAVNVPEVAVFIGGAIGVDTLAAVPLSISTTRIATPAIQALDDEIPSWQNLRRMLAASVKDKRMLRHDRTLTIHNEALAAWLEIYQRPLPPPIAHIPPPRGIRMIAELRSVDHAAANLAYYRRQGYNACLITVDGTEGVGNVLQRVRLARSAGLAPWIAWAGPETLRWSIYQNPAVIGRLLQAAAPLCQGYLVAWRRTSAHLVAQDAHYLEHLVARVRQANPQICVVGESYHGQTWENLPHVNQRGWVARDNVPRNQSAVLIAGIATQNYDVETMLRSTFARWVATPRLALVLGERAYYASRNDTGRSFVANLRLKQQLERRFLRAGCFGTITIHGDGSDRGSTIQTVDDLGKYKIDQN